MTDFSRRSFLKRFTLGTAAAVATAGIGMDLLAAAEDPDRLIWVPGAKKIIDLGSQKLIAPAPTRLKTLSDKELADIFRYKARISNADAYLRGIGHVVRTQRLAIVTPAGFGKFTIVDGRVQGSDKVKEEFRRLDKFPTDADFDTRLLKGYRHD